MPNHKFPECGILGSQLVEAFIHGLRGELHVTWEEGTWASWLYDLLLPQVELRTSDESLFTLCKHWKWVYS